MWAGGVWYHDSYHDSSSWHSSIPRFRRPHFGMRLRHVSVLAVWAWPRTVAALEGVNYHHLPDKTVFPGPWDDYIKAPANKSFITPTRVWRVDGNVTTSDDDFTLRDGRLLSGGSILVGESGHLTVEFTENIAGRYDAPQHPPRLC